MHNNLKFRVGALVLGVTLAVAGSAFKPAQLADDLWGRDANGVYTNITQNRLQEGIDFTCDVSSEDCKVSYPVGQDPNSDPSGGTPVGDEGVFRMLQ